MNDRFSDLVTVYCTVKDAEQGHGIGRALVKQGLAACVNLVPQIESIYEWEGKLCEDSEALLLIKTRADRFPDVARCIRAMHSYDVPCITALPIADATEDYAQWIRSQTASEPR